MKKQKTKYGKENSRMLRAAGVVGLATSLSRVLGYIRDMVVAAFFGAGIATDAFFVAFRIPNLLRRLFAEGSLTISFVPVFTEYLKKKSKAEALELVHIAFTLLSLILVLVSVGGILFAPLIVTLMAPGFTDVAEQYRLAVLLTRIMFPYILLISLVALCMGILNSLRHFAAPALAPVFLNLSMIAAALFLKDLFQEPIIALAVGVIIGGIMQLGLQFPFLKAKGISLRPNFNFKHPAVRRIALLMFPAVFGAAVYQINMFISTILASLLPAGSVSYLYYADRIVQLPLGIFAIAVGTAALPSFSEHVAEEQHTALRETVSFALRFILFLTIPAMIALVVLRVPIISVLFQRGEFDSQSTAYTAQALLFYAAGLWAFSVIKVLVSVFYSLQDTKTPVKIAVAALVVNLVCSIIFMYPLRHGGLALATSIASAVNAVLLFVILKRRIGAFLDKSFYQSLFKVTVASGLMAGSIAWSGYFMPWNGAAPFVERFWFLLRGVGLGVVVFFLASYMFRNQEFFMCLDILKRKFRR